MAKPKTTPEKLSRKSASEFRIISQLSGPIGALSFLQRSLLFAEISMVSYMHPQECAEVAKRFGFTAGKFVNADGAQAYIFRNEWDCVVVCRGTEANEWNDIKADLYALMALAETVGRVHRGFKKEVDDLWHHLEEILKQNDLPLWFTGHSLGGAMAAICAGRCFLSHIQAEPEEIYTYGSPRIGNKRYVNHTKVPLFRWVNNNDIVTRVPPVWVGYRHAGSEFYIDRNGSIAEIQGWKRFADRLKGAVYGLARWRIDLFSDHLMGGYIDSIDKAIKKGTEIHPMRSA